MSQLPLLYDYPESFEPTTHPLWPEIQTDPVSFQKGIKLRTLLLFPQGAAAAAGVASVFPPGFRYMIAVYENQSYRESLDPRSFPILIKQIIEQTEKDPSWINKFVADFSQASEKLTFLANAIFHQLDSDDRQTMKHEFQTVYDQAILAQSYGYITEIFGDTASITHYIKRLHPTIQEEEIAILLSPIAPSFIQRYHEELAHAESANDYSDLIEKYYWIKGSYFQLPELTMETLEHDKKGFNLHTADIAELKAQKETIINRAILPEKLKNFVHIIEQSITLQDERKANVLRLNYAIKKIVQLALNHNSDWTIEELLSCTPSEIIEFLDGKLHTRYKATLAKRDKKSVWIFGPENYLLSTDSAVSETLFKLFNQSEDHIIQGQIAYKGNATGKVKVILSEDDFHKMEEGDILVAWMTRPEYLPIMKKAKAIITNEGGITSHAAIIARELKIPCVIGTKTATQILKDNDLIEVDAHTGKVTKL